MKKSIKYKTNIRMTTRNIHTGEIIQDEKSHNIVVDTGLEHAIRRIFDTGYNLPNVIGIGTGTTSETAGDTDLETEITRATATVSFPNNGQAELTKEFTFASGESYSITEVGIFDSLAPTGSILFNREVQSAKSVDVDTSLTVTITVTASDT